MAIPFIGAAISAIASIGKAWMEKKKVEAEGKVKIAEAKVTGEVKRIQTITEGEIKYDQTIAEGMRFSWKDEYWTLVLSIPAILCFIPGMADLVTTGFQALKECPDWYQWALLGAIVASFGLRTWTGYKK
jgi:hypothetical protein